MTRCDATTLASAYSAAHQCLKTAGIKIVNGHPRCSHHRAARSVSTRIGRHENISIGRATRINRRHGRDAVHHASVVDDCGVQRLR